MKKNVWRLTAIALLLTFLLSACEESPAASPTPQIGCGGFPPPQQPYGVATFEDMVAFLNTVNANVFEAGNFKEIIDRTRADGYILRPYFDNKPASLNNTGENRNVLLCPRYDNGKIPPGFMYHLREGKQKYRIEITYIEEEFVYAAEENGFAGFYAARNPQATSKTLSLPHTTVTIGGIEKNVTITNGSGNSPYGEFVWDKYLIRISGDLFTTGRPDAALNTDLFSHISFRKIRLNPEPFWPSSPRYGQTDIPIPHQEHDVKAMAAFLHTADAETFQEGRLKTLISQAQADGYILEPYFDGKPTYLAENGYITLAHAYFEGDIPMLVYPCLDGELFLYYVQIYYLPEHLLPIAKEGGALALHANMPDMPKEELTGYKATEYQTENYCFTIVTAPETKSSYAEILLEDTYLIQIFGDKASHDHTAHNSILPEILDHISFQKHAFAT